MKISIITLHRVFNYGSIFQAYATQKIFEKTGNEVEIIDYITEQRTNKRIFLEIPKSMENKFLKKSIYIFLKSISIIIKKYKFGKFIRNNLKLSKYKYISFKDLKNNPPKADLYVTGSDQVWNSKYNEGIDRGFFLDFIPDNSKKIAYASSFGKEKLDNEEIEVTKRLIHTYKSVSVREKTGLNILETLEYEKGIVLIDPTLQICKEEWLELASKRLIKEKYLLLFLIYNEDNNGTELAKKIAKEKGLKLVVLSWKLIKPKDIDILMSHRSPENFLSLVYYADYIVTNSFHGLAFSLNLNKEFIVIKRNEFNTRIDNLLELVNLKERLIDNSSQVSLPKNKIDYRKVNQILDKEREKAKEYINNCLKLK